MKLLVLLMHPRQQRSQLIVGFVLQRRVQIKGVDGLDNFPGSTARHQEGKKRRPEQDSGQQRQHVQKCTQHGTSRLGNAQHGAVSSALRTVERRLRERAGCAQTFAKATFHGLKHLGALQVVFHAVCIGSAVKEDGTAG